MLAKVVKNPRFRILEKVLNTIKKCANSNMKIAPDFCGCDYDFQIKIRNENAVKISDFSM